MFDDYFIQQDVDEYAAEYYQSNFSPELQASYDRDATFDDQYYDEMYAYSDELFDQAFEEFDKANAASEREAVFQLAMLLAAVGLAFAAFASLLYDKNKMRPLFALMSFIMLMLSVMQALNAGFENTGIIAAMIYDFYTGKSSLFIGVRGVIEGEPPRIAPVRRN